LDINQIPKGDISIVVNYGYSFIAGLQRNNKRPLFGGLSIIFI